MLPLFTCDQTSAFLTVMQQRHRLDMNGNTAPDCSCVCPRRASFLHKNQMRAKNGSTEFNHCECFSIPVLLEQFVFCERQSLSVLVFTHVVQVCDHVMTAESTKQTKCLEFLHDTDFVFSKSAYGDANHYSVK